ncbi:hypothetical protein ACFW81_06410 [Streptomyces angustmyceticus]|uniref:hypothetical protein n=1 Tax=Streptomyces angustmyceticus TaxID=285578 RepID=UPI0036A30CDC
MQDRLLHGGFAAVDRCDGVADDYLERGVVWRGKRDASLFTVPTGYQEVTEEEYHSAAGIFLRPPKDSPVAAAQGS